MQGSGVVVDLPPSLPCVAPCARVSRAGAHMRMDGDGAPRRRERRVPHGPTCSCARGSQRRRGWLAGCLDADLPHAACQRGRDGLRPWVCRRPASCGYGGGGSWLGGARGWLLGTGALVRWRWRAELALRSRCARAALAPRYTHAGLRGAGAVGGPRRRQQLPLLVSHCVILHWVYPITVHHPPHYSQSPITVYPPITVWYDTSGRDTTPHGMTRHAAAHDTTRHGMMRHGATRHDMAFESTIRRVVVASFDRSLLSRVWKTRPA